MHQHLCARYKSQTLSVIYSSGTKILHTLIEMGSAALAAAVPNSGKATRISRKGTMQHRLSLKKKKKKKMMMMMMMMKKKKKKTQ